MSAKKATLAAWMRRLGIDRLGLAAQRVLLPPFVRAINYHDVPPTAADAFRRQLDFFAERFVCTGPEDLRALRQGSWPHDRPGLLLSFDDGLRSHADVVAPALEERGWTGWFMVPVGFVDAPADRQAAFAEAHSIGHAGHDYGDPRIALSWSDVRRLDARHVVGCHTWTHTRLSSALDRPALEAEIEASKRRLESELGRVVDVFAWVGGEEASYSRGAAEVIRGAGFRTSFMTNHAPIVAGTDPLQLQRTNVEAADTEDVVRLQISGLMDLLYAPKRRRVVRLTATSAAKAARAAA